MSYGYYRVGSQVDQRRARSRLATAMRREADTLEGIAPPLPAIPPITVRSSPTPHPDTEIGPSRMSRSTATSMGYTGDSCDRCGSMRMKHTGHCNTCEECGETTGCS